MLILKSPAIFTFLMGYRIRELTQQTQQTQHFVNFGALTMHIIWFIFNTGGGRYEEVKYYLT